MSQDKTEPSTNKSSGNNNSDSSVKASVYECTDTKTDGGTIHTRIYCFETNRPIKR